MMLDAFFVALAVFVGVAGHELFGMAMLSRPIVVAPLAGLLLRCADRTYCRCIIGVDFYGSCKHRNIQYSRTGTCSRTCNCFCN